MAGGEVTSSLGERAAEFQKGKTLRYRVEKAKEDDGLFGSIALEYSPRVSTLDKSLVEGYVLDRPAADVYAMWMTPSAV